MPPNNNNQNNTYHIRLIGTLDPTFTDWLSDVSIVSYENGETLLVGQFIDQPALRGFLDQLWNYNFTIVSIEHIGNHKAQANNLVHHPEREKR